MRISDPYLRSPATNDMKRVKGHSRAKSYAAPRSQDSPSRQLMAELAKDLDQVHIHARELHQVRGYQRQQFFEQLDRREQERAQEQYAALDAAAARHDQIRREAEEELRRYQQRVEEEQRQRREEEARRERERQERELAESERREREATEKREAAERAKAEEARKAAQARKEKEQREQLEKEKAEQEAARQKADTEAAERRTREAANRARTNQNQGQQGPPPVVSQQSSSVSVLTPEKEAEHRRYLELHQHLKKFRKHMEKLAKTDPTLKPKLGNMRRTIKKCVGQLTETKGANKQPVGEITKTLREALTISEPPVDVRQFIAFPPPAIQTTENPTVSGVMIYLLSIFSKCVINQFVSEASAKTKAADPIGIVTAQIFSSEAFLYRGVSMIDILICKFRKVCPVLWGVYGDERTAQGKLRIGWRRTKDGPFLTEQQHSERMTGLGAGFAAISLRNFERTPRLQNPFPNSNFWTCLANIVNVPPREAQPTHFLVLKSMMEVSVEKFLYFYGDLGMVALKKALVEFPASVPEQSAASRAVALLPDVLKRDKNLTVA